MPTHNLLHKLVLINPLGKVACFASGSTLDLPSGWARAGESPKQSVDRLVREVMIDRARDVNAISFFVDDGREGEEAADATVVIFWEVRVEEMGSIGEDGRVEWVDVKQDGRARFSAATWRGIEAYRAFAGIVHLDDRSLIGHQGFGLIQVLTGNGKGKTTAATGLAVRALGAGKRVAIVYFDKGGETHYFERALLTRLGARLEPTGRDRIDAQGRFDFSIQPIDKAEAARGLTLVRKFFAQAYDLVILDEINSTVDLGMVSAEEVLACLEEKPTHTEVVLTGRNAPKVFVDRAHLLTEMRLHKHYFYAGVKAREGIDY